MNLNAIGTKLKNYRIKAGETLAQASSTIGIRPSYLSRIESGFEKPSQERFLKMMDHYQVDASDMIEMASYLQYNQKGDSSLNPNSVRGGNNDLGRVQELVSSGGLTEKPISFLKYHFETGEEVKEKMDEKNKPVNPGVQVKIPENITVLYTDSTFVTKNDYGIVMDFAQTVGPTNQQVVVTRVGMSKEHAMALHRVLGDKLKEYVKPGGEKN